MTTNEDSGLDELFRRYGAACPEIEPSVDFVPSIWRKVEARHSFWFVFERLGRRTMTACAALCLVLLVLNVVSATEGRLVGSSYVDALMAEHSAEKTYYTEAIRTTPSAEEAPSSLQR